jgi:predicted  nucleic acid-binding Zn-ribbon protein
MKPKKKKIVAVDLPADLQAVIEKLDKLITDNGELAELDRHLMLTALGDIEEGAFDLARDLNDLKEERDGLESKIEDLEDDIENHPAKAKLAAFEDPANWQGNRWVPVLTSMTSDPLLFIERGY